uniref:gamma-glutamylcyclotransferase n=1 Tax=Marinactinospora thermotolerans TaxID=531310 RepID=UPI00099A5413|nr:gamma-glutamylcyclotransferase [Marinactinospora thermotolerans]
MPLYAAYGRNLDPERMAERAPHSPVWSTGWLEGWRLAFGGAGPDQAGALVTLAEEPGSSVFVCLYDVPEWERRLLDSWEGTDLGVYSRITVRARTLFDGDVTAWAYVLDDYEGGLPSAAYLESIALAAEKAGAPSDYVADLRARPCC